jgi:hypothetical protein
LCMTRHHIIVAICDKYFQNPFIYETVMYQTQKYTL